MRLTNSINKLEINIKFLFMIDYNILQFQKMDLDKK